MGPSPLLAVVAPVHRDRMEVFRGLQGRFAQDAELAAVIVDENGVPMLQVVRVDGARSMLVGLAYHARDWWLMAPGALAFARASQLDDAARVIRRAMRT